MNLFDWTRISGAIVGSLLVVVVSRALGGVLYQPEYLTEPAYKILARPEPYVDLATLRRRWPAALDEAQDRAKLLVYMRRIPEIAGTGIVEGRPRAGDVAPEPDLALPALLARADVAKGERVATKCKSCHTFEQGGPNAVGPNLWNIINSKRARFSDFNYSSAMRNYGGEWTFESLFDYLENPRGYVKGTNMTFVGIKKAQDRANLLAYLRTLSDQPSDLPVVETSTGL
jgi:cytochrome c